MAKQTAAEKAAAAAAKKAAKAAAKAGAGAAAPAAPAEKSNLDPHATMSVKDMRAAMGKNYRNSQ